MQGRTLPELESHAARIARSSMSLLDQPPVFFHQLNVCTSKSRRDIDSSVGDALVDFEFRNRAAIDKHKKETAPALNAQGVERNPSVFIELK
jgi:hypothetical protein